MEIERLLDELRTAFSIPETEVESGSEFESKLVEERFWSLATTSLSVPPHRTLDDDVVVVASALDEVPAGAPSGFDVRFERRLAIERASDEMPVNVHVGLALRVPAAAGLTESDEVHFESRAPDFVKADEPHDPESQQANFQDVRERWAKSAACAALGNVQGRVELYIIDDEELLSAE